MKYYKLISNNMVVDLLDAEPCYVRFLPTSGRLVAVQQDIANGVRGSDGETIYHIIGTLNTFPEEKQQVAIKEIGVEEYNSLSEQFAIQRRENEGLRKKIDSLESLILRQNELLERLLGTMD